MKKNFKNIIAGLCAGVSLATCGLLAGCTTPDGADITVKQSDVDSLFTQTEQYAKDFEEFKSAYIDGQKYNREYVIKKITELYAEYIEKLTAINSWYVHSEETWMDRCGFDSTAKSNDIKFYNNGEIMKYYQYYEPNAEKNYTEVEKTSVEGQYDVKKYDLEAKTYTQRQSNYAFNFGVTPLYYVLSSFIFDDEMPETISIDLIEGNTYLITTICDGGFTKIVFENSLIISESYVSYSRTGDQALIIPEDYILRVEKTYEYNTGDFTVDVSECVLAQN